MPSLHHELVASFTNWPNQPPSAPAAPCSGRAARTPATRRATRRRSTATSSSTSLTRTTFTARNTLPNGHHDNRPALGVGIRFRPVCLASAGSLLLAGHARQSCRLMRRPVRAIRACRQDPDVPGATPKRAAAARVACRCVVPVWLRDREDGLRPCLRPERAAACRQNARSGWRESTRSPRYATPARARRHAV
jgi:hypothetical protein